MTRHRRKRSISEVQAAVVPPGQTVCGILFNVRKDLRRLMLERGLAVMQSLFEEEVAQLCGGKYVHGGDQADRWGNQRGVVVLGGQKVRVDKPRVRRGGREVPLVSYAELQGQDPLDDRTLEQMVVGVSTRKYKRSLEPVAPVLDAHATSKSAVSRRFVARTRKQLEAAMSVPLGDTRWAALLIDGIEFADHVVIIVLGVDDTGRKHVLGMREGSTENATLCRELLADLVGRGLCADRSLLVVMDGGKGLRKAVAQVFGSYAMVQRCQVHKRRNVLDHLPDDKRPQVRSVMEQAYHPATSFDTATRQLSNLARSLDEQYPSAAASLREGLVETLTVKTLGLPEQLSRCLATTNAIENLNGTVRHVSRRVKRWSGGTMVLRWVATGVFEASTGFRRLRGHTGMQKLIEALRRHDDGLAGDNIKQTG